jgi:hypothetical protein
MTLTGSSRLRPDQVGDDEIRWMTQIESPPRLAYLVHLNHRDTAWLPHRGKPVHRQAISYGYFRMGRAGIEPATLGLKVRTS